MIKKTLIPLLAIATIGAVVVFAQTTPNLYTMTTGEELAVVCAHPSIDIPPGDVLYITCNEAVNPPTPTDEPQPTPTEPATIWQQAYFGVPTVSGTCYDAPEIDHVWTGGFSIRTLVTVTEYQERQPIISQPGVFWFGIVDGILTFEANGQSYAGAAVEVSSQRSVRARYDNGELLLYVSDEMVGSYAMPALPTGTGTQWQCDGTNQLIGALHHGLVIDYDAQPTATATATNEPPLPTATSTPSGYPDPPTPQPSPTVPGYPVDPTNTPQPTATNTPLPPTPTSAPPTGAERGRWQVDAQNNVVADNGYPIRGEHMVVSNYSGRDDYTILDIYDDALWREIRDDYKLNTIRLMLSRPPQNWDGRIGANCNSDNYRCYDFDYVFFNGATLLDVMDEAVNKAAEMGMYIVIDYHPVGGHIMSDFAAWWDVVAPRYKDRTHVIYEASNEPVMWGANDYTAQDIEDVGLMYQHIRALAPDTHIILWSFAQGDDDFKATVQLGTGIDYSNASVGIHPYGYNRPFVEALRDDYPMIFSEVGLNRILATQNHEQIGASWIWLDGIWNHEPGEIVTWQADPAAVDR
jgi:hypothetical protein